MFQVCRSPGFIHSFIFRMQVDSPYVLSASSESVQIEARHNVVVTYLGTTVS